MGVPRDAVSSLQSQALDAIRTGQETAAERFRTWSDAIARMSPVDVRSLGERIPMVADVAEETRAIVDSVCDFAAELLTLNKEFVHKLLEASTPANTADSEAPAT